MALTKDQHTPSSGFKEVKTYVKITGEGESAKAEFFDFFDGEYYVNRATGELFKGTPQMFLAGGTVNTPSAPSDEPQGDAGGLTDPNASNQAKATHTQEKPNKGGQ